MSHLPKYLYKYEPFNTRTLENLKAQSIYFGSPSSFNDPYDCSFMPALAPISDETVEQIRGRYLNDSDTPLHARQQFAKASTEELRQIFLRSGRAALDQSVAQFIENRGVSCFSERHDDLLMWSHYGGRHTGFCLEFDASKTPFQKIKKVTYTPSLPIVDITPWLLGDNYDGVMSLFTTKSSAWEYEAEWRAVHENAGTLYCYPADSLTGVFFGPEISVEALEIVCLILRGQNEGVKFWRGRRSSSAYRVEYEAFNYVPYLEARARGLLT
jgi:Protein of unknown function (DUF2971)